MTEVKRVAVLRLKTALRRVVVTALPGSSSLPEEVYRKRHRNIILGVIVGVLVVIMYGLTQATDHAHSHGGTSGMSGMSGMDGMTVLVETAGGLLGLGALVPVGLAVLGWLVRGSRRWGASLACGALMFLAAFVVHLSGTIEAHFLFFIMVPIVALYEDWVPFAVAVGIVFLHHAVMGLTNPADIYNHPAALDSPLKWSLIHGALFAAICVASLIHWRIHERARAEETVLRAELERRALHDPLTQLANRTLFTDSLEQAIATQVAPGNSTALLVLDVDAFKGINDTHGHPAGDALLRHIAERLRVSVRSTDTVARLGGDEFAIVMPNTSEKHAQTVAHRIASVLLDPVSLGSATIEVSASIGVAVALPHESSSALYERADQAMYEAKRTGHGPVLAPT
ncbi:diguanylate cyclase domain-containing protein [Arthrobacter sp. TmT3-37]